MLLADHWCRGHYILRIRQGSLHQKWPGPLTFSHRSHTAYIFSLGSSSPSLQNQLRYEEYPRARYPAVERRYHELSPREDGWAVFESFMFADKCLQTHPERAWRQTRPERAGRSSYSCERDCHWSLESLSM